MGSQVFQNYSMGKNVQNAYNKAVQDAEEEYGHQEGYSGEINSSAGFRDVTKDWKASKLSIDKFVKTQLDMLTKHQGAQAICIDEPKSNSNKIKTQVEYVVTPGTKKWVLMYVVYCNGDRITGAPTKTEALKLARDYSEKHHCTTIIKMERRLEKNDQSIVAKVTYKKSSDEKDGKWMFFGWAAC